MDTLSFSLQSRINAWNCCKRILQMWQGSYAGVQCSSPSTLLFQANKFYFGVIYPWIFFLLAYPHWLEKTVDREQCSFWSLGASSSQLFLNITVVQCLSTLILASSREDKVTILDITMGFCVTSWTIEHLAFGVILVGCPLLGRVTTVLNVLHLYITLLSKLPPSQWLHKHIFSWHFASSVFSLT